jgi:hypothetical protein
MSWVYGNQVFGVLTPDDRPAVKAVLDHAGITGVDVSFSRSGNAFFLLDPPAPQGNGTVERPEVHQRVVDAFTAAGWTVHGGLDLVAPPAPADGTPPRELWTVQDVADFLGVTRDSARGQLSRWGVKAAYHYREGNLLASLFRSDEVRAAHAARPGRGKGGGRPRKAA